MKTNNQSETKFYEIVANISYAFEGKMFGALCIKTKKGKAAAILWQDNMLFKLDEPAQQKALLMSYIVPAKHLYDKNKQ